MFYFFIITLLLRVENFIKKNRIWFIIGIVSLLLLLCSCSNRVVSKETRVIDTTIVLKPVKRIENFVLPVDVSTGKLFYRGKEVNNKTTVFENENVKINASFDNDSIKFDVENKERKINVQQEVKNVIYEKKKSFLEIVGNVILVLLVFFITAFVFYIIHKFLKWVV